MGIKLNQTKTLQIILLALLMWLVKTVNAQCNITTSGNFCVGSPITFYCNSPGSSNIIWDFNKEGANTSSCNSSFTFNTPGVKTIKLNLNQANGSNCNNTIQITIGNNPIARIKRVSNKTQCFKNNKYCFTDSSVSGNVGGNICERIIVFDDGTKYTHSGNTPWSFCHSFQDPNGGYYGFTLQVIDCSGCSTTLRQSAAINVLPSLGLLFSSPQPKRCDSVQLCLTNKSAIPLDSITSFKWIWGDGTETSGNRNTPNLWKVGVNGGICHWFYKQGPNSGGFTTTLTVTDNFGCRDTFSYANAATNFIIKPQIIADFDSVCSANATVKFKLKDGPILQASNPLYTFEIPPTPNNISRAWEGTHTFKNVGPQKINFSFTHTIPSCGRTVYDTILVLGPQSIIEGSVLQGLDFMPEDRSYQCVIKDTIEFYNFSKFYHNDKKFADDDSTLIGNGFNAPLVHAFGSTQNSLKASKQNRGNSCVNRIWDFDDIYCEQCTTDTKKGINVDKNCRYSKDSLPKHWYTPWDEVYERNKITKPYKISRYNVDSGYAYSKNLWANDSIAIVRDTIVYYGDNALATKTKDSSVYKGLKKVKVPSSIFGPSNTYFAKPARLYIASRDTIWVNLNNGFPSIRYIGPRYVNIQANSNVTVQWGGKQVYYNVWVDYIQDTIATHLTAGKKVFKTILNPAIKPGDSISAASHRQRFYASDDVRCYKVKLTQKDICHPMACASEVVKALSLFPANSKHLRKKGVQCLGNGSETNGVTFILDDAKAGCTNTWAEINFDTNKNPNNWQTAIGQNLSPGNISMGGLPPVNPPYLVPTSTYKVGGIPGNEFSKTYERYELSDTNKGHVSVGLIMGNGIWDNGDYPSSCVDTTYYPNFLRFPILDNSFEIVNIKEGKDFTKICKNQTIALSIGKQNKSDIEQVGQIWYTLGSGQSGKYYKENRYYRVLENYLRNQVVPGNTGFLMDYLQVVKYEIKDQIRTIDSVHIPIAKINAWHQEADVSEVFNEFKLRCASYGLDLYQMSKAEIARYIWNGVGTIGKAYTNARGFIDTTGIGSKIIFNTVVDNKTTLHFKDTSLLPLDKTMSWNNKQSNAYSFKVKDNGLYRAYIQVVSQNPKHCTSEILSAKKIIVGFYGEMNYSDTIICHGQLITASPQFRYFEVFPEITQRMTDPVDYWRNRISEAGNANREGYTRHDLNKDDDGTNVRSTFGGWPYSISGIDNSPQQTLIMGGGTGSVYYNKDTGAAYLIRTAVSDSTGCLDTIPQYVYTTAARAHFHLDQTRPLCTTMIELFDSSYIIDPLLAKTGKATDKIIKWSVNWGDKSDGASFFNTLPNKIGHAYPKNGYYTIRWSIETELGCTSIDSTQIYIPGPIALFDTAKGQIYCNNKKIYFKNQSQYTRRDSSIWIWEFGDNGIGSQRDTVTSASDTMGHIFQTAGTYSVKLTLFYQRSNFITCSSIYPDTSLGQAPISITIDNCNGSSIASNALSNNVKLYPNPALNKVNIDCKEKTDILIYDSRGVLVDEITCEGLKTFDLKYLGTGLYFFVSKENQLLGKLIVE